MSSITGYIHWLGAADGTPAHAWERAPHIGEYAAKTNALQQPSRAFSSEVGTGSREETAPKKL
jgi:hypothetical protein